MTIWRMRIACRIPKATNTYTGCVTTIIAFPLQQWLQERVSMLRYTYIASIVIFQKIRLMMTESKHTPLK